MQEHPIIFSTPMVKAVLDLKKTQTRRTEEEIVAVIKRVLKKNEGMKERLDCLDTLIDQIADLIGMAKDYIDRLEI